MSRYSRINAIWKKELIDTLRDRRTVLAMVVLPIVLYPGMILASLMAFEVKTTQLKQETYRVAVADETTQRWLRRLVDTDAARRTAGGLPAEDIQDLPAADANPGDSRPGGGRSAGEHAKRDVRHLPPEYEIVLAEDVQKAVASGDCHVGIILDGPPPSIETDATTRILLVTKEKEIRSEIAAAGIASVLDRAATFITARRLQRLGVAAEAIAPIEVVTDNVATEQEMQGWFAGMMIPPILIILTITGTIYPAIDLTAGERERGTLETLMVAPVPPIELITGKFIVVTLIGLISAMLNLTAFAATMYFGGLGEVLTEGWQLGIPLSALPWVLVALLPLTVMFGAILLAVSSFARSFKEAQNYVMPVIMAAILPAFVGIMPGTRMEGPVLIMPVANIVVLTRELFMGHFEWDWIFWVFLSTSLYAAAAVVIAAKLFGQEAVLFADAASIRAMLRRASFEPRRYPTAAQAMLLLAVAYPLNFFVQNALQHTFVINAATEWDKLRFVYALGVWLPLLFVVLPWVLMSYARVEPRTSFGLRRPAALGIVSAVLLGCSTWVLALWWHSVQQHVLPMSAEMKQELERAMEFLGQLPLPAALFFLAIVPAICEELFFRGYALNSLSRAMGAVGGMLVVSLAFGIFHGSIYRLIITIVLGMVLCVLAMRWNSTWPAILAHVMHNSMVSLVPHVPWLSSLVGESGFEHSPPTAWVLGAAGLSLLGLAISLFPTRRSSEANLAAVPARSQAI